MEALCLPRDVWAAILQHLYPPKTPVAPDTFAFSIANSQEWLLSLVSVCSCWRDVIYSTMPLLVGNPHLTDDSLIRFSALRYLGLGLLRRPGDCAVTNEGLTRMRTLTTLEMDRGLISDDAMQCLDGLTSLFLCRNALITDAGIRKLVNLTSLALSCNRTALITTDGLLGLEKLTSLRLHSNDSYIHIGRLTGLTRLSLTNSVVGERIGDIGEMSDLRNLTDLELKGRSQFRDAVLKAAVQESWFQLRSLSILSQMRSITDDGVSRLVTLESLTVNRNFGISNDGIRNLTNLTFLDATQNYNFTEDGLKDMTKLQTLVGGPCIMNVDSRVTRTVRQW